MIHFVLMDSGKKMPVEATAPIWVAVKSGAAMPGADIYKITTGLIPHWINCPYAKGFRKK